MGYNNLWLLFIIQMGSSVQRSHGIADAAAVRWKLELHHLMAQLDWVYKMLPSYTWPLVLGVGSKLPLLVVRNLHSMVAMLRDGVSWEGMSQECSKSPRRKWQGVLWSDLGSPRIFLLLHSFVSANHFPDVRGDKLGFTSWWEISKSHCRTCTMEALTVAIFVECSLPQLGR